MESVAFALKQFAATCQPGTGGNILGFPTWYKYLNGETFGSDTKCNPTFVFPDNISNVLLAIFEIILRVGALVAIGFIIYAGFQLILSSGESERVKSARSTIINALIGLVITTMGAAVVNLIGRNIIVS